MTVQFGLPIVGHPNANVIETMDSGQIDPCHEYPSPGYTEHSLSSDWSTYASSPNSLFMYEQERSDMLNSYDTCGLTTSIKMEDMNELSPGMEDTSLDTWCPGSVDMSDCSDGGSKILESWAVKDMGLLNMDDVFQRDSTDLVHGPTLAELNSQDSLNFLDIGDSKNRIACSDIKIPLSVCRSGSVFDEDDMKPLAIKIPTQTMEATKTYRAGANVSILPNRGNGQLNALPATTLENFTLQQLLASNGGQPSLTNIKPAAKSSRATSTSVIETKQVPLDKDTLKKWEEIKEFIHSDSGEITTEVAPRRIKSESGIDNVMVKEEEDEDFMDDDSERSDDDDDDDDDNVSEIGQRSLAGILHGGKQRRGDGNDVLPNPRKMYNIGLELKKLNKLINDMTPVSELPVSARPRSRREKNKLASRACRLKKKAQHEANKVKLFGLDREHERLNAVLHSIKDEIQDCAQSTKQEGEEKMSTKLQNLIKKHLSHMIAGHTTEYVNSVLDKVATGDPHGGLKNY